MVYVFWFPYVGRASAFAPENICLQDVFVLCFEWLSADLPLLFPRGYLLEKYDNPVLAGP